MGVLDFIAGIAAIILTLELLVVAILTAAVCVGVWYGLRFAERKSGQLFEKGNGYIAKAREYEHRGLRLAARPLIMAHELGANIGMVISTLARRSREAG